MWSASENHLATAARRVLGIDPDGAKRTITARDEDASHRKAWHIYVRSDGSIRIEERLVNRGATTHAAKLITHQRR